MWLVIYDNRTNKVIGYMNGTQTIEGYTEYMSEDEKANISGIYVDEVPRDYYLYKVMNGELARLTDREIQEYRLYGRFLSQEERLLESMKPSHEEIQKAEETLRLLELLQEVMV